MQKLMDDIDRRIEGSSREFNLSENYNEILMNKIQQRENKKSSKVYFNNNSLRVAASSLILSGILIAFLSVPNVQYELVNIQCRIRNAEAFIQYNYNFEFFNNLKGE